MARKSKGFGELLDQQRNSQFSPLTKSKLKIIAPKEQQPEELAAESNFDEQEQRIVQIVGLDNSGEVREVNALTLKAYREYLKQHLELPCYLTGSEDFPWEEYYVIGPGSKKEHERLRKTKPSYLDTFEWLEFHEGVEGATGLLVSVRRVEDRKTFVLPLADLEALEQKSKNYQLLNDYAVWFVNWY